MLIICGCFNLRYFTKRITNRLLYVEYSLNGVVVHEAASN